MAQLPVQRKHIRTFLIYSLNALFLAMALSSVVAGKSESSGSAALSKTERAALAEKRRQAKRMYSLFDHVIRICLCVFLSAVFAGLTLGVMCADTFTLEIIAESGPAPDCKYAAQVLPLRKQGHKTLCTLIVSNMLCNTLVVQEFSSVFDIIYAIRTHGNANNVVDNSGSQLLNFVVSTFVIVIFAEIVPMSICKSKYSLRVAAAGSMFVKVAMVLTYPVSAPLGKFLDWVVGTEETGQVYDRKELRKLMMIHYDHERGNGDMPKTELNLLLAAMDFQERKVRDIMTPIDDTTYVNENDVITPDFAERLWLSGRSRVPVESAHGGRFLDVLVVKDLLTVNISTEEEPLTVAQVVKARNRLFVMVGENTKLPAMMKFFQDAKTHMAVVFAEEPDGDEIEKPAIVGGTNSVDRDAHHTMGSSRDGDATTDLTSARNDESHDIAEQPAGSRSTENSPPLRRSFAKRFATSLTPMQSVRTVGIVTMEDVVEELLNDEIYDEYDRYEPEMTLHGQKCSANPLTTVKQLPRTPTSDPLVEEFRLPAEPTKPPRANFYSYFTHPENNVPLSEAQIWAVAYFLSRSVKAFMLWPPAYVKALLDDCEDLQLVPPIVRRNSVGDNRSPSTGALLSSSNSTTPGARERPRTAEELPPTPEGDSALAIPALDLRSENSLASDAAMNAAVNCSERPSLTSPNLRTAPRLDHGRFLAQAPNEACVLYAIGVPSENFTLVLGGQVDMLVGSHKFYSRLRSFQCVGEEALTKTFYAPDFSAIVRRAARVYSISKEKYEKYLSYQTVRQRLHSHLRVLRDPLYTVSANADGERDRLLQRTFSDTALEMGTSPVAKAYGTFKKDKY